MKLHVRTYFSSLNAWNTVLFLVHYFFIFYIYAYSFHTCFYNSHIFRYLIHIYIFSCVYIYIIYKCYVDEGEMRAIWREEEDGGRGRGQSEVWNEYGDMVTFMDENVMESFHPSIFRKERNSKDKQLISEWQSRMGGWGCKRWWIHRLTSPQVCLRTDS